MPLEIEVWDSTIQEKLTQDNSFLTQVADVSSDNIINGTIVHLPQAGDPSAVVKNRTQVPATPKRRTDGQVLYLIDEYTTDPVYIPNAETVELSYDKRRSVLDQDVQNLSEEVAEGMLTNFIVSPTGDNATLPTASILETSGAAVDSGLAGSTGKRKAYAIGDLQKLRNFLIKQKAWNEGVMNVLLTPDAATQMFPAESAITATYMAAVTEAERRSGIMYKCQGFNIFVRSSVYTLAEDKSFKAYGSVVAPTDCEGIFAWNKNMLEKAIGTTKAFEDIGSPTMYGDVYSFLVRVGGRARRKNFEGLVVLKQAASA
ncbi:MULTISPECIES: hypothetical protein [Elizabethkingia]|uniref:Capsid protein n=1 Tax=Elizabethkingia bruuniana TaxID=1756149 RepID=A0A5E8D324_9FLAO|nr:hypothetical protein [Elizabethkingia bruuniana]KGO10443.1 hypothetical protein KS04_09240 [Elizabethkingia miricola]HAT4001731.1 hypothetical protein [Elizabethkingia anophelis]AQX86097.1 hypothetical protein AYC65_14280 [Elizabethkingia bruuniana]AQX86545.1 hypothetical protein AYC65_16715 [Elizabethkingia bruuniana]QDZ64566.1 hypothetical protein EVD20_21810 [Elizabethkingia bruuniana]